MGILSDQPQKEPMHYGEVYGLWGYLLATKSLMVKYQTFVNHTGDQDLRGILEEVQRTMKQEIEQVEKMLKVNGVELPPAPPERPTASSESIPAGARFNDQEIAGAIAREESLGGRLAGPFNKS